MPARKPRKNDRVRILVGSANLVGTVAQNARHLPNPYLVDIDLDASRGEDGKPLDEDARAFFGARYAGPYKAHELVVE